MKIAIKVMSIEADYVVLNTVIQDDEGKEIKNFQSRALAVDDTLTVDLPYMTYPSLHHSSGHGEPWNFAK